VALTFRERLLQEFAARRSVNRRYSLRAFAAMLDVDHATLSQIFRGKRSVPAQKIGAWGRKLKLLSAEVAVYGALARVLDERTRLDEVRLKHWGMEVLSLLLDPAHLGILQQTRTAGFRPDSRRIAQQLDCSVDAVNVAVSRLLRLGLLDAASPETWRDKTGLDDLTLKNFREFVATRLTTPDT